MLHAWDNYINYLGTFWFNTCVVMFWVFLKQLV